MSDNFKIDSNVPWIVRLYTIWKPIYKKESNEYKLNYIEFLVFIHSVLDSNGNEIDKKYIESIEVVGSDNKSNDDFSLKLPEVLFEEGKGGKDIKKFKMNNISVEEYDAEVWNLNNNLTNKTSCEYKQYYTYANFVDDLYGINGSTNYDEYKQKMKKRKTAYNQSLLFKIHLQNLAVEANFKYDADANKYKETANKYTDTNKKVVYAVASNPFFLPSILFDDRSNDNQVYSFFNTDELNTTKAFICSHDVNNHADHGYKIDKSAEFAYFYNSERTDNIINFNYVYAVKSLYSSGNIKLELCSPFEWEDENFNIYSRYNHPSNENYEDSSIKFNDLKGNIKYPKGFTVMSEDAKQIICYHNGVSDNNNSNSDFYLGFSDYDTSYIVNDKTNLLKKDSFKERFCIDETEKYDPAKYIDCGQRKAEINFGTIMWQYQRYNTMAKLKYTQQIPPFDENNPKGIAEIYKNTWFFGDVCDKEKPCILFYGMYDVKSIL